MTLNQIKTIITGVLQGWFPNKKVLDKLNEVNGKLYYNGIEVCMNSLTEEDVKQAIASALAELNNKVQIETKVSNSVIADKFVNDYDPIGNFVIKDRNITVTYENLLGDPTQLENAMNDMARFFGTLQSNGIVSIKYNNTNYIWNEELGLKGSNWVDENNADTLEGTLVKKITDDFKDGKITIDSGITLFFDDIEFIYTIQ